ncbi:MAG: TetR/AcrR family transcriptional regulator [Eubacteriales bacterium]|nr:TetR/AcrR family transcriptional regulator [Eubacteriales bacterium]
MTQRIQSIVKEATYLFLRQGYSKTQISHIAKAAGVSVGTIYHDFVGKKEIMHYILKSTIQPSFAEQEIETPICDEHFTGLEQEIVRIFEESAAEFQKPLLRGLDGYSFEMLISDAFHILSRYAVGCLFIEKNQQDFPFLADHYKAYRKEFLTTMTQYLMAFMEKGQIRKLDDIELTTILIVEILSWWAMDMRYTSFEISNISVEAAKRVCMDNILSAYKKN